METFRVDIFTLVTWLGCAQAATSVDIMSMVEQSKMRKD